MRNPQPRYADLPWNGAKSVWSWVRYQGEIVPVVGFDDQYCIRFPDGSTQWIEKWDAESIFWEQTAEDVQRMKDDAARRPHRNKPIARTAPEPCADSGNASKEEP